MKNFIPSAAILFFLLSGPCFGAMTDSQCTSTMKSLERQSSTLSRQLESCKGTGDCAAIGVRMNRIIQQLSSTKRQCAAARTPAPTSPAKKTSSPAKSGSSPEYAGGEIASLSSSETPSLATPKPDAISADDSDTGSAKKSSGGWDAFVARVSGAGSSLLDVGKGVAGDLAGILVDVPVGIFNDLAGAGKNLLKGNFVDAAKGVGGAVVNAAGRTAGGVVDSLAKIVHGGVDMFDNLLLGKALPRKLTAEELALLKSVYKGSVDWDAVRIREDGSSHAVMPSHVIGNTIYFNKLGPLYNADKTLTWEGQTLVHETGHVWQYQHGGGDYLHKAFFANAKYAVTEGDRNKAYEWKPLAAQGVPFSQLNPEQQATVIDNLAADDRRPEGKKYLTDAETQYARQAMVLVWAGKGAP